MLASWLFRSSYINVTSSSVNDTTLQARWREDYLEHCQEDKAFFRRGNSGSRKGQETKNVHLTPTDDNSTKGLNSKPG